MKGQTSFIFPLSRTSKDYLYEVINIAHLHKHSTKLSTVINVFLMMYPISNGINSQHTIFRDTYTI